MVKKINIVLEVVHVPGTTLVMEGTGSLSRDIWISALHEKPDRQELLAEIFAPVPFLPDAGHWVMNEVGFPPSTPWSHWSWELDWCSDNIFDHLTIWAPPPEVARQLIYALLQLYVERALTMAMILLLP